MKDVTSDTPNGRSNAVFFIYPETGGSVTGDDYLALLLGTRATGRGFRGLRLTKGGVTRDSRT